MPSMTLAGFGTATKCEAVKSHSPKPLRFIWHHILPQVCGGKTVNGNLVELCDNCHYGVHELMWDLRNHGGEFGPKYIKLADTSRGRLARQGYNMAKQLGTVGAIPKE